MSNEVDEPAHLMADFIRLESLPDVARQVVEVLARASRNRVGESVIASQLGPARHQAAP